MIWCDVGVGCWIWRRKGCGVMVLVRMGAVGYFGLEFGVGTIRRY